MIEGSEFAKLFSDNSEEVVNVEEKLFSTGDEELDELLEKVYSEGINDGYDYAQKEFASVRLAKKAVKRPLNDIKKGLSRGILNVNNKGDKQKALDIALSYPKKALGGGGKMTRTLARPMTNAKALDKMLGATAHSYEKFKVPGVSEAASEIRAARARIPEAAARAKKELIRANGNVGLGKGPLKGKKLTDAPGLMPGLNL